MENKCECTDKNNHIKMFIENLLEKKELVVERIQEKLKKEEVRCKIIEFSSKTSVVIFFSSFFKHKIEEN